MMDKYITNDGNRWAQLSIQKLFEMEITDFSTGNGFKQLCNTIGSVPYDFPEDRAYPKDMFDSILSNRAFFFRANGDGTYRKYESINGGPYETMKMYYFFLLAVPHDGYVLYIPDGKKFTGAGSPRWAKTKTEMIEKEDRVWEDGACVLVRMTRGWYSYPEFNPNDIPRLTAILNRLQIKNWTIMQKDENNPLISPSKS
jgi:hypothetical protein